MSTEQLLLMIFGGIGAVWAVFRVILPRYVDAKIKANERLIESKLKAEEYERVRMAFREDKTFEMLEDTLAHWKASHDEERQEASDARSQQTELIQPINKIAANVDRQTDIIRILVQQVTVFDDRLRTIEGKVGIDDTD